MSARRSHPGVVATAIGALLLGVGNCSSPADPQDLMPEPRGGGRLRVISWRSVPDGQTVFAGWRDSVKGIDCEMKATGATTVACLPFTEPTEWTNFRDRDCRLPVTAVDAPPGEVQISVDLCIPAVRVFRPGAIARPGATVFHFDRFDGSCEPSPDQGQVRLMDDVTAEFAALEVHNGPVGGGIAPRLLVGQDGARDFWGWWDTARGAPCRFPWLHVSSDMSVPWLSGDDTWRCLPMRGRDHVDTTQVHGRLGYGDAQCSSTFTATVPTFAQCKPGRWDYWWGDYAYHAQGCDSRVKVWGLGPVVGTAYYRSASGCQPEPRGRPLSEVRKLEVLDFRGWPTGALGAPQGEGRLKVRRIETAAAAGPGVLWDTTLDSQCRLAHRADGEMSCLPGPTPGGSLNTFYADASCTRAVIYAARPCPEPRYQAGLAASGNDFRAVTRYRVSSLEKHTGPVYQKALECQLYSPEHSSLGAPTGGSWYTLGAEIPVSDLVRLERIVQ